MVMVRVSVKGGNRSGSDNESGNGSGNHQKLTEDSSAPYSSLPQS